MTTETEPATEPIRLDDASRVRAKIVGEAIQHAVAKRPDIAVSVVGIGLDAVSSRLITAPDDLVLSIGSWLQLGVNVFNYIVGYGETTEDVTALLAGTLPMGGDRPGPA